MSHTAVPRARFRELMPAFVDEDRFPDAIVDEYLRLAREGVDPVRWAQFDELGQCLWAAHMLALDEQDQRASRGGNAGGAPSGPVSSKSVGGASVSYATAEGADPGSGHWNLTSYGKRWRRFARLAGMGGTQVGPVGAGAAARPFVRP